MKIRPHLLKFERISGDVKRRMAELIGSGEFRGLNCRLLAPVGWPKRIVEFFKNSDWASMSLDGGVEELKREVCNFWSNYAEVKPEQVKIGAGSMKIMQCINKIFLAPGIKTLGVAPQFYGYPLDVRANNAHYKGVLLDPKENLKINLNSLLNEIKPDYSLIYLDNPNNPTGQLINLADMEEIVREAKKNDVVVIVDEAYADLVDQGSSAICLLNRYDNLVVVRSFTKGYRFSMIGYGILSPTLGFYYDKLDFPPAVPKMNIAVAKEALLDKDYIPYLRQKVRSVKSELTAALKELDFNIAETCEYCEIFVLGHKNRDIDLWEYLIKKGILTVSSEEFYDSPNFGKNHVRVNIPMETEEFLVRL
ncbi:aminotransferase class I/II-fold pyridoxal phosphate-dependent enzyme [Chloroflexota bacterium]